MKNVCKNCKHNDEQLANKMFFTNYCTIMECQMSGRYRCDYKVRREKLNIVEIPYKNPEDKT